MKRTDSGFYGPEMPPDDSHGYLAAETDFLPEFCHYEDEGCELSPACLDCPFPQCADEVGPATIARYLRNAALLKLHFQEHVSVEELACRFQMSVRSVGYFGQLEPLIR